jgi:hypothetical protein
VSATLVVMGKKKPSTGDRHKPRRLVGIPERICLVLEAMGESRETSLTEMVKAALIDYLERQGQWPPSHPKK